jgi:hypothetical protein
MRQTLARHRRRQHRRQFGWRHLAGLLLIGSATLLGHGGGHGGAAARETGADATATEPPSCARAYHRSLQALAATAGADLQAAADLARRGDHVLPGYWLFWEPGQSAVRRKLTAIGARSSVIVIEDRICTRSVLDRGGRIRCLKWEPKPENFKPPPLTDMPGQDRLPPLTDAEAEQIKSLTRMVADRGAVADVNRRGRFYELTKRVGGELLGFLGQDYLPTICTGSMAMAGFYERRLAPITNRLASLQKASKEAHEMARRSVALALVSWENGRRQATAGQTAGETGTADGSDTSAAPGEGNAQSVDLSNVPSEIADMILAVGRVMLPREIVGHIEAEGSAFDRLVSAREGMSAAAAGEAPAHVHAAVYRAFRAIEIAYYARLHQQRFADYAGGLSGLLGRIRESHETDCRCE